MRMENRAYVQAPVPAENWIPDGIAGWLDDADNVEMWSSLLGGDRNVRFIPQNPRVSQVSVPCRTDSIAAFLIRNAGGDHADRLETLIQGQATTIAEAGLFYHQALLEYHHSIIEAT